MLALPGDVGDRNVVDRVDPQTIEQGVERLGAVEPLVLAPRDAFELQE